MLALPIMKKKVCLVVWRLLGLNILVVPNASRCITATRRLVNFVCRDIITAAHSFDSWISAKRVTGLYTRKIVQLLNATR